VFRCHCITRAIRSNFLFQLLTQILTEMKNTYTLPISADSDLLIYIHVLMRRIIYIRMFLHSCMEVSLSVLGHLCFCSVYTNFPDRHY
jgi:hypothetical protein